MNWQVFASLTVVLAAAGRGPAQQAPWAAGGEHVLVIYAADGPDRDGSGTPDSKDAAEYYASRRGVPAENVLAVKAKRLARRRGPWTYREVFQQILTPAARKLASKADGKRLGQRICYILLCPDIPVTMVTHPPAAKGEKSWFRKTRNRSVDGYLISLSQNVAAGLDDQTGAPGPGAAGPLGSSPREIVLPVFGVFLPAPAGKHFRQLRHDRPDQVSFHLVTRLGLNLDSARDMLDGALYAERHLRLPDEDERTPFRPAIWLDQKYRFASDHVTAMSRVVPLVRGVHRSPFAGGKGLLRTWPLVIDNQLAEIGSGKSDAHKPTVTATIAAGGVDAKGVTLSSGRRIGRRGRDASPVLYFPPGCRVTCVRPTPPKPKTQPTTTATAPAGPAPTARVVGCNAASHRLLLDSTKGFKPGWLVKHVWPGEFPADDCFIFYGFYGLGAYEDVFRFPPGALGVHVDSSCMTWARRAIDRGIAATFGVTAEPLSAGIPYGNNMLLSLASGYDWAESAYGALRLGQRWTGVVFGDPLYAPFRSMQLADKSPPVIGPVTVKPAGRGAVIISARLAGKSDDELADVALFKLEYGSTKTYATTVDFLDWPQPAKGRGVKGRRFGYSRHFRRRLTGLEKAKTYHYRLTARDPAGLDTRTADATFQP